MSQRSRLRVEIPTLLLGLAIYGAWLGLTWLHHRLPTIVVLVAGAWIMAWHGSLQHEAVHRHPFTSRRANALFAGIPLALWLPFPLYRSSHLAHHGVRQLTCPRRDPESFYVDASSWTATTPLTRAWLRAESTLLGRLLLGPFRVVARLLWSELSRARREPFDVSRTWSLHALAAAPVLYWVTSVCGIDPLVYLLFYVYPGLSLTLLRSFVEHRAEGAPSERSVIIEAEAPLALLFLHNNLHALHHAEPAIPWYALPGRYREQKDALLADNGHYFFRGYREVARRFLLRPKGAPLHPGGEP